MNIGHVPSELTYLYPVAEKYGQLWFEHEVHAFVARIAPEQIAELSHAYSTIRDRGDAARIQEWIADPTRINESGESSRTRHAYFMILRLFEYLGDLGHSPFTDGTVRYSYALKPRLWSRLPERFAYLVEPAERFGVVIAEQRWDPVAEVSDADLAYLSDIAAQIKDRGDYGPLLEWMNRQQPHQPEPWSLDRLLELMDSLGLDFGG